MFRGCRFARAAFALGLVGIAACSDASSNATGPTPGGGPLEQLTVRLETAHFRVMADRAPASTTAEVGAALEGEFARITADLAVTAMPVVTAQVWSDLESFYREMEIHTGQRYTGATGFVGGPAELSILDGTQAGSRAVHEFAHLVSLAVNPRLGNNPRWLWEAVALFENGELVNPRQLPYLVNGQFPTLATLDSSFTANRQIYEVGYLLGDFIVSTWGRDGLIRLIQANGRIDAVLGLSTAEFERRWADFVRTKYLQP